MRLLISAIVGFAGTAGAYAASECPFSAPDSITVEEWSIALERDVSNPRYEVAVTLKNDTDKEIVMVAGDVQFYDLLDRKVTYAILDPDLKIEPRSTAVSIDRMSEFQAYRLPDLNPDQVTTVVCLSSVAYADGTVERFPIAR